MNPSALYGRTLAEFTNEELRDAAAVLIIASPLSQRLVLTDKHDESKSIKIDAFEILACLLDRAGIPLPENVLAKVYDVDDDDLQEIATQSATVEEGGDINVREVEDAHMPPIEKEL